MDDQIPDPEDGEKIQYMRRTGMIRAMTQPKEIKGALNKIFASPLVQKRCKLNIAPSPERLDRLQDRLKDYLENQEKEVQIDRINKKEDNKTMHSLYATDMMLFLAALQVGLNQEFGMEINEVNERLLKSILDIPDDGPANKGTMTGLRRILVADDNRNTRLILSTLLRKDGRFLIEEADNGEDVLKHLIQNKCDMVLLDVDLPRIHGLEVLRLAMTKPELRKVLFIMVSAVNSMDIVKNCLKLGAKDYVLKPFKAETLLEKIQSQFAQ